MCGWVGGRVGVGVCVSGMCVCVLYVGGCGCACVRACMIVCSYSAHACVE